MHVYIELLDSHDMCGLNPQNWPHSSIPSNLSGKLRGGGGREGGGVQWKQHYNSEHLVIELYLIT